MQGEGQSTTFPVSLSTTCPFVAIIKIDHQHSSITVQGTKKVVAILINWQNPKQYRILHSPLKTHRLLRLCNRKLEKIHSHCVDRCSGSLHLPLDRSGLCILHPARDALGHAIVPTELREATSCNIRGTRKTLCKSLCFFFVLLSYYSPCTWPTTSNSTDT